MISRQPSAGESKVDAIVPQTGYPSFFDTSQLKNDLGKRTARGGLTVMGADLAAIALRVLSVAVLARLLMPEDFGLLAMVTALTTFAERFKDFGLSDAITQKPEIDHAQVNALFWINIGVCAAIALILAFLAKPIAWFYDEPRVVGITLVISSAFLFSGLAIQHRALLRRQLRLGRIASVDLTAVVLSLAVAIALAWLGAGYWALVAREFSRAVFGFLGMWVVCLWRPSRPARAPGLRGLLSFGKYVTGFNIVHFLSSSLDRILVGRLHGSVWLGLYGQAHQLVMLPVSRINTPVRMVALPTLSALQKDSSSFRAHHRKLVELLAFGSMPLAVYIGVFSDATVYLLLGGKWADAVPLVAIFSAGVFILPVTASIGPAMLAVGRTKEYFRLGVFGALSMVCCLAIGSIWGAAGVAAGYSVAAYLSFFAALLYGLRRTPLGVSSFLRSIAPPAGAAVLMGVLLLAIRTEVAWLASPASLPLSALAGGGIYLSCWLVVPSGRRRLVRYLRYPVAAFTRSGV